MTGAGSTGGAEQPYFFLSYARSHDRSANQQQLTRFYDEIRGHLSNFTTRVPGFMDVNMTVGGTWSDNLAAALAGCQVFVPVLKDGYCRSVWCGKEWGGFDQRLRGQATSNGGKPIAIVPVLWIPRDRSYSGSVSGLLWLG